MNGKPTSGKIEGVVQHVVSSGIGENSGQLTVTIFDGSRPFNVYASTKTVNGNPELEVNYAIYMSYVWIALTSLANKKFKVTCNYKNLDGTDRINTLSIIEPS